MAIDLIASANRQLAAGKGKALLTPLRAKSAATTPRFSGAATEFSRELPSIAPHWGDLKTVVAQWAENLSRFLTTVQDFLKRFFLAEAQPVTAQSLPLARIEKSVQATVDTETINKNNAPLSTVAATERQATEDLKILSKKVRFKTPESSLPVPKKVEQVAPFAAQGKNQGQAIDETSMETITRVVPDLKTRIQVNLPEFLQFSEKNPGHFYNHSKTRPSEQVASVDLVRNFKTQREKLHTALKRLQTGITPGDIEPDATTLGWLDGVKRQAWLGPFNTTGRQVPLQRALNEIQTHLDLYPQTLKTLNKTLSDGGLLAKTLDTPTERAQFAQTLQNASQMMQKIENEFKPATDYRERFSQWRWHLPNLGLAAQQRKRIDAADQAIQGYRQSLETLTNTVNDAYVFEKSTR